MLKLRALLYSSLAPYCVVHNFNVLKVLELVSQWPSLVSLVKHYTGVAEQLTILCTRYVVSVSLFY